MEDQEGTVGGEEVRLHFAAISKFLTVFPIVEGGRCGGRHQWRGDLWAVRLLQRYVIYCSSRREEMPNGSVIAVVVPITSRVWFVFNLPCSDDSLMLFCSAPQRQTAQRIPMPWNVILALVRQSNHS